MGQKMHPHGLRVGIIKDWDSRWFANKKDYSENLIEDQEIRKFLKKKLLQAGIAKIEIERKASKVIISIHTAKPGFVIGKGGELIDSLKKEVETSNGNVIGVIVSKPSISPRTCICFVKISNSFF
jgi:small subunit ribosomal protein S3